MSDYHTTALLFLTTTVLFGLTFLAYAQTTDVRRHFDFGDSYNVRNVNGLSIGTTTINTGGITFGDGTVFNSSDAATSWTSTSTGIFYNEGNVGIGVDSPSSLLDVNGNIYGTTFYDYNNTSYYVNPSGSSAFAGDVGIGLTSPSVALDISGNSVTSDLSDGAVQINNGLLFDKNQIDAPPSAASTFFLNAYSTSTVSINRRGGNVGIGNDNPDAKLDVSGNTYSNTYYDKNNTSYFVNPAGDSTFGGDLRLGGDTGEASSWHNITVNHGGAIARSEDSNKNRVVITNANDNRTYVGAYDYGSSTWIGLRLKGDPVRFDQGNVDMESNRIVDLGSPTNDSDAATKSYVDSTAGGGVQSGSNSGDTLRWDGSQWVSNSNLYNDGSSIGIGRNASTKLTVNGSSTTGLVRFENDSAGEETRLRMRSRNPGASDWFHVDLTSYNPSSGNGYFGIKTPFNNTDGSGYDFVVKEPGNVGINTTSPSELLHVVSSGDPRIVVGKGSGTELKFGGNVDGSITNDHSGWVQVSGGGGGSYPYNVLGHLVLQPRSSANRDIILRNNGSNAFVVDSAANVGIGDSSPDTTLDVAGNTYSNIYYDQDNTSFYVNPSGASNFGGAIDVNTNSIRGGGSAADDINFWSGGVSLHTSSGDRIEFWDEDQNGRVVKWTQGSGEIDIGSDLATNLDMNSNDITNADKIDANTVDPVYRIGSDKYATYMAGMTGVKEETTGSATLQCEKKQGPDCEYTIDFGQVEKGTNLWLFARTSDFGENWKDLRVIVSPREEAGAWSGGYSLDPKEDQLSLHAEPIDIAKPVSELTPEVSYRLTAPRFDSEKWGNRYQGESEGMTVPMK